MKYVLDTCSYYWLVDDQTKLSAAARSAIGDANSSVHLSVITVTEIHRLVRQGRISIQSPNGLEGWFQKASPSTVSFASQSRWPWRTRPRHCRESTTTRRIASSSPRRRFSARESCRRTRSCRSTPASPLSGDAGGAQDPALRLISPPPISRARRRFSDGLAGGWATSAEPYGHPPNFLVRLWMVTRMVWRRNAASDRRLCAARQS